MSTDDTIKNIITTTIQTKVIEALNDTPEAVGKLIEAAVNRPVGQDGRYSTSAYNTVPYIEWLVGDEIRTAAHQIVKDVLREYGQDQLAAIIRSKLSADKIAEAFAESVVGAAGREWDISVQFRRNGDR